jgi:hypothetical protein
MERKRTRLDIIIPAAILLGAAVFGTGYSLRPTDATTGAAAVTIQAGAFSAENIAATARLAPRETNADVAPAAPVLVDQDEFAANTSEDATEVRVGTIVSMNGELLILRDDDHNTWYHLDDQHAAGAYLGKKVQVKGAVDPATDEIHVESIQDAKA